MSFEFTCACGKTLEVPDSKLGKREACPYCGNHNDYPRRRKSSTSRILERYDTGRRRELRSQSESSRAEEEATDAATLLRSMTKSTERLLVESVSQTTSNVGARRRLIVFVVLLVIAIPLALNAVRVLRVPTVSEYELARDSVLENLDRAREYEAEGRRRSALNRYRVVLEKVRQCLDEEPEDEELLRIQHDSLGRVKRLESLQSSTGATAPANPDHASPGPADPDER